MQLALSLTQKNTKTDASNAKYCNMFHDKDYFFCVFILQAQNKSIIMKYSPGCIFTAVVISRWVMHNAERGQFILLLQILQISLKNQPLCKIFANYHQESTTLHKMLKITMKNQPHCTNVGNYYERSAILHNFSKLRWKIHRNAQASQWISKIAR